MNLESFILLLTILSIVTSLLTEGIKKFLESWNVVYAANIVVLIVSVIVGGIGTSIFYLWNDLEWTTLNFIVMFLMIVANWLGAMLGYDKTLQTIEQIKQIIAKIKK